MKAIKFIVSTIVLSTILMSCGNTSNEKSKEQTESQEEQHQDEEGESIVLNNGEKWLVNDEMKPHILEAETVLNEYTKKGSNGFTTLATQLKEKNSGLIKSCTMKGESHDELHKWLYPHIQLIDSLAKAENVEDANAIINQLKSSFRTYHNYFI